ncbi:MAG TPA: class I SAM-dependent methyltransferase [Acidobacteriaceae bacterium]
MRQLARFDRLARLYFWMEYLSFGPYLQRCRCLRLPQINHRKRALVYGDGDGRFLKELARVAPSLQITAVDASEAMLRRARLRLPANPSVQWVHADARQWEPPRNRFDLVVSHFFLDCFDEEEIAGIVSRVNAAAADDAVWVVSEFAIPSGPFSGRAGRLIVGALYLAFGWMTGLTVRQLPDYAGVLGGAGWQLEDRRQLLRGLLVSEVWRRTPLGNN